ncbi:MAG: conjugal transfer protein TraH [Agitococcus sp.]|nr:conjugal transfer protein TraH [Agitococcus sp.]MDO9176988.1 conjugal transfer protein TraH [Agitococcus sp.]
MFKKLFITILAMLMATQPLQVFATDLTAAFGNLLGNGSAISVNQPGAYQSGTRNSFIAGGLEMRVPRQATAPQLFSVTPPKIYAGCGGISAHFGGFSFISGPEFEKLLKSIASGAALGFVSMLVLKTLCPSCEAVVQFLKTAAQQAARLAKDSCKWGADLAKSLYENPDGKPDSQGTQNVCGTTVVQTGTESDFVASMDRACSDLSGAVSAILGENPQAKGSSDSAKANMAPLSCALGGGIGNVTWQRLSAFDRASNNSDVTVTANDSYTRKLILMNLLGVQINADRTPGKPAPEGLSALPPSCPMGIDGVTTSPTDANMTPYCPARLTGADIVPLFMCGAPSMANSGVAADSTSQRVVDYCSTFFTPTTPTGVSAFDKLGNMKVFGCGADKKNCNQVMLEGSEVLTHGTGFLVNVNNLLRQGVDAVRRNETMPLDVLKLMQKAPFPIYQAINAAAVYPTAADDLVDSISILVSEQLAVSYLDELLRVTGRDSTEGGGCLSPAQASKILEAVSEMRATNKQRLSLIAQNLTIQQGLSEQIRLVNLAIQKQVMTADMLGQNKLSQSMTKSLTQQNAGYGNNAN